MKTAFEKLIESFKSDGLELTEAQKTGLNSFADEFNTKIDEARSEGKATAKDISIKLTEVALKEYDVEVKEATEKLIEAIDKNYAQKVQLKVDESVKDESATLVEKIDDYLGLYIKELIPESLVVDYDKMQRQVKAVETIKEALLITDDVVQAKAKEVSEAIGSELTESKEKLNAELEKNMKLNKVIQIKMADELLESKIEDLPEFEATKMRKYFESSSSEDIEDQFDTVYESIKASLNTDDDDLNESKIKEIISEEDIVDESKNESIEDRLDEVNPLMESWIKRLNSLPA